MKKKWYWPNAPKNKDKWLHLVLNYIGPDMGQGVEAFRDGTLRQASSGGSVSDETMGTGQVVVGRRYINKNEDYSHAEVDELIFFNQALSITEVGQLYNMY